MRVRPRILARYLLKETTPFTLLAFAVLTTLIFAQQIGRYAEIILSTGTASLRVLGWILPSVITITLPMALLLGAMMALNRLSADSEIIAATAGGMSLRQTSRPLLLLGVLVTAISAYLTIELVPRSLREIKRLRTQILLREFGSQIKPQTFTTVFPGYLIFVEEIDPATGDWLGVFLLRDDSESHTSRLLTSQRGQLRLTETTKASVELQMLRGTSLEVEGNPSRHNLTSFDVLYIRLTDLNSALPGVDQAEARTIQELTWRQLTRRSFAPGLTPKERAQNLVEWHKRLAAPLAGLALVCLAIPIGATASRHSGRTIGVAIGFTLALAYYLVLIAGQNLSLSGALPPWAGVWLANLVCLALAALLGLRLLAPSLRWKIGRKTPGEDEPTPAAYRGRARGQPRSPRRSGRLLTLINYLLLSEFIKYFALGLGILVLTSVIFTLFDLIPAITRSGVGSGYAAAYLLYLSPQITYFVTPFALLLGILTTYAVLSRSNQITILLASGQGALALTVPLLLATGLIALALFYLSDSLLPRTNREQDARYHHIKGRKLEQATVAFGQKWVRGSQDTIYGYGYLGPANQLLNTIAYRLDPENHLLQTVSYAAEARQLDRRTWQIQGGWQYRIAAGAQGPRLVPEAIDRIVIPDGADLFKRTINEATKMSYLELKNYIRQLARIGAPTAGLRIDLGKKISFPASCFTLAALGLAFTFSNSRQRRRGALTGLGISIMIGLVFWSATSLFEMAGKQAWLPVWMSVWGAQIIFLACGTLLFFRRQA